MEYVRNVGISFEFSGLLSTSLVVQNSRCEQDTKGTICCTPNPD